MLVFAEKLFLKKLLDRIPAFFSRLYLLLIVLIGWVFFYHIDMGEGLQFLGVMFGRAYAFTNSEVSILFRSNALFLVLAVIASTPLAKRLFEAVKAYFQGNRTRVAFMDRVFKPVINIFILVLSLAFLVGQSYNPFLYFRF